MKSYEIVVVWVDEENAEIRRSILDYPKLAPRNINYVEQHLKELIINVITTGAIIKTDDNKFIGIPPGNIIRVEATPVDKEE